MNAVTARLDPESDLQELARIWKQPLGRNEARQLLAYAGLLIDWNQSINLTGAKSVDELVRHHMPDVFAAVAVLGRSEGLTIGDVGAGGGLPGIPLAMRLPSCRFVLFEPVRKKVAFLRTACRELGLGNVSIVAGRVDPTWQGEIPRDPDSFESGPTTELTPAPPTTFDVVSSRATFPPADWLKLAEQLVRKGGRVLAFTSGPIEADKTPTGLKEVESRPYTLLDGGKRLVIMFKRT